MNDYKSYYQKALNTCIDSGTTSTSWYYNFVMAISKLEFENKQLKLKLSKCLCNIKPDESNDLKIESDD